MVKIKLVDNYLLLSDPKQWIIAKQTRGDRIDYLTFHSTLEGAINSFFQLKIRLENSTNIKSLMIYQKTLLTSLSKALRIPEIRIEIDKSGLKLKSDEVKG